MSEKIAHDVYDHSMKLLWQYAPEGLLRLAYGEGSWRPVQAETVERVQSIRRSTDIVHHVEGPQGVFVSHVEYESSPKADIPDRLLLYQQLIRMRLKKRLPIRTVVFFLNPPDQPIPSGIRQGYGGEVLLDFQFRIVHLYRIASGELAKDGALAAITPLGEGFIGHAKERIWEAARTIRQTAPEEQRANQLFLLRMVSSAKGVPMPLIETIIQLREVQMSDFYQAIIEEGDRKGLQKGRQEGERAGLLKGVEKLLVLRYGAAVDLSACEEVDLEWAQQECLKVAKLDTFKKHLHARLQKPQS